LVHVWSTRHRNRAVRNGRQRCIVAQVADVILGKQAPVQNPDKDGLLPGTAAYGRQAARLDCSGHPERGAQAATSSDQRQRQPARRAGQSGGAKTCRRAESGYRRICQDVTHSATPERRTFQLRPVWCCLFTLSGGGWLLRRGLRGAASSGPGPCRDPGSCFFSAEGSPGSVGEILYDPLSVQPPTVLALGSSHQRGRRWGDGWVVDHVQDLDPVEWGRAAGMSFFL
jgi:hypothetical protein